MLKRWFAIGCVVFGLAACNETSVNGSTVPYAPVGYTINITTEYPNFRKENGFSVLPLITAKRFDYEYIGYAGLLVWVGMDNEYHAADLCCPHCLLPNKPIEVNGMWAVCPTCGEEYDISYGYCSPRHGISKYPLKRYTVLEQQYMAELKLYIRN